MRRFSEEWFKALENTRFTARWRDFSGPRVPIVPWVTPPLHPSLRSVFDELGETREFEPGDWLYPHVQVRSFMYVESGLTGRVAASLDGQSGAGAMALTPPLRHASGNLNWITGRSAIGRYLALSHVRIREIRHTEVMTRVRSLKPKHYLLLLAQNELINLTDRMGFAVLALLPAMDRFKALLLAWALFYGQMHDEAGRLFVRIPVPGRKTHIANVVRTSLVTLDTLIGTLRDEAGYRREGDFVTFEAAALQSAHDWMRHADGEEAYMPRPKWVADMLLAAQEEEAAGEGAGANAA